MVMSEVLHIFRKVSEKEHVLLADLSSDFDLSITVSLATGVLPRAHVTHIGTVKSTND